MKQKIEWYREVLDLEPNSKVFFPLAKLLAHDGQTHEAVITLRQGIVRHPDHMEAHLLLVELLLSVGPADLLAEEVDKIASLLEAYPRFWEAWADRYAKNSTKRDAGLALTFFATSMQKGAISWAEIIEYGLKGVLGLTVTVPSPSPPGDALPIVAASVAALQHSSEPDVHATSDDEEAEEPFSLRTKSMAEILAEQGDVAGALDIYQELISAAPAAEKVLLRARVDELSLRMQTTQQQPEKTEVAGEAKPPGGRSRIADMFEALAQRLEAKSLQ